MRKLFLAALLAFCVAAPARAEEKVALLDGVYSVTIPDGWTYEQDEDGFVSITPEEDSPRMVIFLPPNPTVEGDIAEYAGVVMGLVFAMIGDGQVVEEREDEFKGCPSVLVHFTIPAESTSLEGIGHVFDYNGYGVLALAMCPMEDVEDFMPAAAAIFESYDIDDEGLARNKEQLEAAAGAMEQEILELLGQN